MATAALVPVILLGRPGEEGRPLDLGNDQDRASLLLRAERLLDLAPNSEGSTWFFAALEQDAIRRGDKAQAARWSPLARRTLGTGPFAPTPPESNDAGLWVQLAAALSFAVLACAAIKSLRSFSLRHGPGAPWWKRANPFSRWDRGELVGFLAAVAVMVGVSGKAAQGVAILGEVASAPISLASGNPGHPESRGYLDASPEGPATRFFRALAAHKAGDLDAAERIYQQLGTPEALANLGAIARVRGDQTRAQDLWKQALGRRPDLDAALHNLGQPTASPRAERFRRYQIDAPLLAVPGEELWGDLWRERVASSTPKNPLLVPSLLDSLNAASPGEKPPLASAYAATLVDLALVGLALLALLSPRKLEPARRPLALAGAGLSAIAPGASRIYGPLSCFVGALVVFLAMGSQTLDSTGGQSVTVLGSLAGVNWAQYHGAALVRPELAGWHGAMRLWWVLLLVNLLLVLAFELRPALRDQGERRG
jgi:tetratricopeptide (TPR) repeat protein